MSGEEHTRIRQRHLIARHWLREGGWIVLLFAVVAYVAWYFFFNEPQGTFPWDEQEPTFFYASLAVVFILWLKESTRMWQERLPKRLTVTFRLHGKPILVCEEAYLAGEGDIRAWGQQIGRQMTGDNLDFCPDIQQPPPRTTWGTEQKLVRLYEVTMDLRRPPDSYNYALEQRDKGGDSPMECLLRWQRPFDNCQPLPKRPSEKNRAEAPAQPSRQSGAGAPAPQQADAPAPSGPAPTP